MAKPESHIPNLRFSGFSDEWHFTKFKDIYSKVRNGFVGIATPYYVDEGITYVQGRNIKAGKLLDNGYVNISNDFHMSKPNSTLEVNDLLMVQSGHVGECAVVTSEYKGANCHAILVATPKSNELCDSNLYVNYFLSDFGRNKIHMITTGNTIQHILSSDLKEISVPKISIQEQTKIGDFFQKIDQVIELQQKLLETARDYKKSMLQKMFPQKGKKVPQVRFDGFSGDWDKMDLEKCIQFSKGKGYSKSDLIQSGSPIILYGSLYTNFQTNISTINAFVIDNNNSIYSEGNEVLIPSSGETAVDIARASAVTEKGIILGGDLNILKPNNNLNSVFLALTLTYSYVNKLLVQRAQGNTVVHLYNSDIKTLKILSPEIEEQQKIGAFFQKLDQQIEQHDKKLESYQQLKKAMLQRMFV